MPYQRGRRLSEIEAEIEQEKELLDEHLTEVEREEEDEEMSYYSRLGEIPWGVNL